MLQDTSMAITGVSLLESHSMSTPQKPILILVGPRLLQDVARLVAVLSGLCGVHFEVKSEPELSVALKTSSSSDCLSGQCLLSSPCATLSSEVLAWQPLTMELLGVLGHRSGPGWALRQQHPGQEMGLSLDNYMWFRSMSWKGTPLFYFQSLVCLDTKWDSDVMLTSPKKCFCLCR